MQQQAGDSSGSGSRWQRQQAAAAHLAQAVEHGNEGQVAHGHLHALALAAVEMR
jgi:hypothetical protein